MILFAKQIETDIENKQLKTFLLAEDVYDVMLSLKLRLQNHSYHRSYI